jgi:hypothetical protein
LLGLFFDPEDKRQHVPPKCQLTFNGLHGVIFQKAELFRNLFPIASFKNCIDVDIPFVISKVIGKDI